MKKLLYLILLIPALAHSQSVYDMVSIGAGYANQSFYSLANGEVSNVSNTDWDLAFQISGFQATIRINGKNNVHLYQAGIPVSGWSAITPNDTTGVLTAANELLDQDTSWWAGAFNITNDATNQFDLGWGVYDFVTHVVTGDSLYFIKLSGGNVKKLWIQSLQNSTYLFTYADLDGSNEVNASLSKTTFAGKNFGYWSLDNDMEIDREPNKYTWDLTFAQYMAVTPFVYKVAGVLSNDSVQIAKAYPVDVNTVTPWGLNFSYYINTIGYDWKSYDFNNNLWSIEDSLVYFVYDRGGVLWKLRFSGFSGSLTGEYEFYKEPISATGIDAPAIRTLGIYPNPANDVAALICVADEKTSVTGLSVYDINGRVVLTQAVDSFSGLKEFRIPVGGLQAGIYTVRIGDTTRRLMVAR